MRVKGAALRVLPPLSAGWPWWRRCALFKLRDLFIVPRDGIHEKEEQGEEFVARQE